MKSMYGATCVKTGSNLRKDNSNQAHRIDHLRTDFWDILRNKQKAYHILYIVAAVYQIYRCRILAVDLNTSLK